MGDARREAWITGIGLVSCLGEGEEAHWAGLSQAPRPDLVSFAPYIVHPIAPLDFDKQIPKRGDQRQMEPWQRIGTYTAGLALDSARLKGNAELLARTDMIVAAGGGERDLAVDSAILSGLQDAANPAAYLNERLMGDLRPTLFLAQLANLLAGNISIVHGVTGSSRTFMGEEAAGVDAVRVALSRIASGQSDIALVGAAHSGERKDLLNLYEFAGLNLRAPFAPVWERRERPGFALGSLAAFLVLEAREHAERRGACPRARLAAVVSDRSSRRKPGLVAQSLRQLLERINPPAGPMAVISGASGAEPATGEERQFLAEHPDFVIRATGSHLGHALEPQFPMNIAIAALAVGRGTLFAPLSPAVEKPVTVPLHRALVTGVGHWRGEGMALVEAVT
jgi:3-oxoacyl-[acyl-carrier-protein] synthase II